MYLGKQTEAKFAQNSRSSLDLPLTVPGQQQHAGRAGETALKTAIFILVTGLCLFLGLNLSGLWEEFEPLYGMMEGLAQYDLIGPVWWLLAFMVGIKLTALLWRLVLVSYYRPAPQLTDAELPACTVVVPAYNEGRQVLETLRSLAACAYPADKLQLIAVDDGSVDDTWQWMRRAGRELGSSLELVRLPQNRGKRRALYEGILRATGEILITIDSDCVVEPQTLRRLVAPFVAEPKVGAVAGNVRVLNRREGVIPRMMDVSFTFSFDFIRASQSQVNTVMCTPGALSAYRLCVVRAILDQWLNQRFLGTPAKIGEDRAMTNLILREGWLTRFQRDAVVHTNVPTDYRGLCKMLLRWARSNVRETLVMSRFLFKRFRVGPKSGARANLLLSWLTMSVGEVLKVAAVYFILSDLIPAAFNLLSGAVIAAVLPAVVYVSRHKNSDSLWAFPYALFWIMGLSWISLYALGTARRSGWLTRQIKGRAPAPQVAPGLVLVPAMEPREGRLQSSVMSRR